MKKYVVKFYDYDNGATSEIDVINVPDNYTAEDYKEDCIINDEYYEELFSHGEVSFEEVASEYKVCSYPEGEVVLETDDLAEAINKCSEIEGFILDSEGNNVEY